MHNVLNVNIAINKDKQVLPNKSFCKLKAWFDITQYNIITKWLSGFIAGLLNWAEKLLHLLPPLTCKPAGTVTRIYECAIR